MTFMLHDRRTQAAATIAIALDRNRGGSDFSERDRLALSLLRPHLATAHANAVMMSAMRRRGSPLADGPDSRRYETIVLTPGARHALSQRARRWLTEYFDDGPLQRNHLPDTLQRWIRQQEARLENPSPIPPSVIPLIVEREQRRLSIRLIPNAPDNILILEEERAMAEDLAFQRLGLTPREAQVLRWVAEGKSNPEIGIILGACERTVAKHLQRIHAKLGVESRTAAARFVLSRTLDVPLSSNS
jgi:DNA-binding CsgD family transcriptional regulator